MPELLRIPADQADEHYLQQLLRLRGDVFDCHWSSWLDADLSAAVCERLLVSEHLVLRFSNAMRDDPV